MSEDLDFEDEMGVSEKKEQSNKEKEKISAILDDQSSSSNELKLVDSDLKEFGETNKDIVEESNQAVENNKCEVDTSSNSPVVERHEESVDACEDQNEDTNVENGVETHDVNEKESVALKLADVNANFEDEINDVIEDLNEEELIQEEKLVHDSEKQAENEADIEKASSPSDAENGEAISDGEIEEDGEINDLEDGEINEEENTTPVLKQKSQIACRFFKKGHCFYGSNCQFMHVADNVYKMFDHRFPPPFVRPPFGLPFPPPPFGPPVPLGFGFPPPPPLINAWENGLEVAKVMKQQAMHKRDDDAEFEIKKLYITPKAAPIDMHNPEHHYKKPYEDRRNSNGSFRPKFTNQEDYVDPWRRSKSPKTKDRMSLSPSLSPPHPNKRKSRTESSTSASSASTLEKTPRFPEDKDSGRQRRQQSRSPVSPFVKKKGHRRRTSFSSPETGKKRKIFFSDSSDVTVSSLSCSSRSSSYDSDGSDDSARKSETKSPPRHQKYFREKSPFEKPSIAQERHLNSLSVKRDNGRERPKSPVQDEPPPVPVQFTWKEKRPMNLNRDVNVGKNQPTIDKDRKKSIFSDDEGEDEFAVQRGHKSQISGKTYPSDRNQPPSRHVPQAFRKRSADYEDKEQELPPKKVRSGRKRSPSFEEKDHDFPPKQSRHQNYRKRSPSYEERDKQVRSQIARKRSPSFEERDHEFPSRQNRYQNNKKWSSFEERDLEREFPPRQMRSQNTRKWSSSFDERDHDFPPRQVRSQNTRKRSPSFEDYDHEPPHKQIRSQSARKVSGEEPKQIKPQEDTKPEESPKPPQKKKSTTAELDLMRYMKGRPPPKKPPTKPVEKSATAEENTASIKIPANIKIKTEPKDEDYTAVKPPPSLTEETVIVKPIKTEPKVKTEPKDDYTAVKPPSPPTVAEDSNEVKRKVTENLSPPKEPIKAPKAVSSKQKKSSKSASGSEKSKHVLSKREMLLQQLRLIEDAIARKKH